MRKHIRPYVVRFHKMSKLKGPEGHYLKLLQLYMSWINKSGLKKGNQSYEVRYKEVEGDVLCNIKKRKSYWDIDYEELQNLNFFQSDEGEDNAEFLMINPNLLDRDFEDSDSVSNATVMSTMLYNLLLPSEQFY